jgi:hypothetical protein
VEKKDDKSKMCIDYCALNKITIKNNYLLPCIDDLLDQLNGINYLCQIDLRLEYYLIKITKKNVEKMIIRVVKIDMTWPFCIRHHTDVCPNVSIVFVKTNTQKTIITFELPSLCLASKNKSGCHKIGDQIFDYPIIH